MAMYSAVIVANFANNKPRLAKTNANNNDNMMMMMMMIQAVKKKTNNAKVLCPQVHVLGATSNMFDV